MDSYENEPVYKPRARSPYADSPYESAYVEPEVQEPEPKYVAPKRVRKPWGWKWLIVVAVVFVCCLGTTIVVGDIWQDRMDRMEAAMNDKFEVLKELYESSKTPSDSQQPNQGPMTPGQVYAKNVDAVVAINAMHEMAGGYGKSIGTGFIISADGYVITNHHVIDGASQVTVQTHKGTVLEATVVGTEATNDIALLKVNGENLPYVTIGSSDKAAVGDQVAAIGNPLGELTATLTVGYISAKDRIVDTDGTVINMLQTDAAINSGNSGGPLFNMNGEVVGITTAKYSGNSNSGVLIEGLGFAIPMDDVTDIISDLKEYGYVRGVQLGVYVRDVDTNAQSYGLPAGAYVAEVTKGTCAERAGIHTGDIIVNIGGYDIDSVTTLTRILRRFEAGETTSVTVYRAGRNAYLTITFDAKPAPAE